MNHILGEANESSSKGIRMKLIAGLMITLIASILCGIGTRALILDMIIKYSSVELIETIAGTVYMIFALLAFMGTIIFAIFTITQAYWLVEKF